MAAHGPADEELEADRAFDGWLEEPYVGGHEDGYCDGYCGGDCDEGLADDGPDQEWGAS